MMDKALLIRNFSRYAHLYDRYANVQRNAAYELIKELPADGIGNILEIGCGTGNYTCLLREKFKNAHLEALDISDKMIEIARQKIQDCDIEFVIADAEEIELNNKLNLITSNATFQWFDNLERAIARYKNALIKKGIIAFSIFGPLTFWELSRTLVEALNEDVLISSNNFLAREELNKILEKYFREVSIKELIVKEVLSSLVELLSKIKYTGVRGSGINGRFASKQALERVEEIYKSKFGQIEVTYQIFFCKAIR